MTKKTKAAVPPKKIVKKKVAEKTSVKSKSSMLDTSSKKGIKLTKLTVKDLVKSSAAYNPRKITSKRLLGLKTSYDTYGDLSGVVLNIATGTLVGGHQRIKTLEGHKTRIVKEPHEDHCGTVAIGHIEVVKNGRILKIPYREVNWGERKAEKAANIAANSHGGEFDTDKLASLVEELDMTDAFQIEALGLDTLMLRQLTSMDKVREASSSTKLEGPASFEEYDKGSFAFTHTCPRCSFKYN